MATIPARARTTPMPFPRLHNSISWEAQINSSIIMVAVSAPPFLLIRHYPLELLISFVYSLNKFIPLIKLKGAACGDIRRIVCCSGKLIEKACAFTHHKTSLRKPFSIGPLRLSTLRDILMPPRGT